MLKDNRKLSIKTDIIIWTAGIKGSEVIENSLFLPQIEADSTLKPESK
ncbi:MAG: hypothetical protein K2P17_07140 [Helicobacteraceae bacterium]|nr:hypothetical protein [Helicobacteraceae bacterium]